MSLLIPGLTSASYSGIESMEALLQNLRAEQATTLVLVPQDGEAGLVVMLVDGAPRAVHTSEGSGFLPVQPRDWASALAGWVGKRICAPLGMDHPPYRDDGGEKWGSSGVSVNLYTDDTYVTDLHGKALRNPCSHLHLRQVQVSASVRIIRVQETLITAIPREPKMGLDPT